MKTVMCFAIPAEICELTKVLNSRLSKNYNQLMNEFVKRKQNE